MKGGRCSNCSCGKINEPFAGYGLKLGGSSCGIKHKGGSSCKRNYSGGGAHKMNHSGGSSCGIKHKGGATHGIKHSGGSSCGRNHRGGFQEPLPGNESKTLQAVPKTNQKGGGKSKRKLQSNKRKLQSNKRKRNHNLVTKRNNKKNNNKKLRGGSIKCPAFYFDLKDQMKGLAVVKRRESCRSS